MTIKTNNRQNQQKRYNSNKRNDYENDKRSEQRSAETYCWKCKKEGHVTADCRHSSNKDKANVKEGDKTKNISADSAAKAKKFLQIQLPKPKDFVKIHLVF